MLRMSKMMNREERLRWGRCVHWLTRHRVRQQQPVHWLDRLPEHSRNTKLLAAHDDMYVPIS